MYIITEIIVLMTYKFQENNSYYYLMLILYILELVMCSIAFVLSFKYL